MITMEKSAKIYIAGHRGMVGSAIKRKLNAEGYHNIIHRTSSELDLRNQDLVNKIIETFSPVEFSVDYYGYSKNGWKKSDAESLANAEFFDIHEHKTLAEDFAAGARGVACIRMVS